MPNRLKDMGETASWRLMVSAAVEGAKRAGYELERQPGRGLSNTYRVTKDGEDKIASVRTTRDRWIAFPPLDGGTRWKTLDDVELVLVAAVDDHQNPQNVDVYLFPADEVRKRFDASYAARVANGHTVRNDYGMWVKLDAGDPVVVSQAGAGLAEDYPRIARFTIDELEAGAGVTLATKEMVDEGPAVPPEEESEGMPALNTVGDVLTFAREKIATLTGLPADTIKLDLKMGV